MQFIVRDTKFLNCQVFHTRICDVCNTASLGTLLLSWWIPKSHHSSWNDVNIASEVEVKTTSGLAAAMSEFNVVPNKTLLSALVLSRPTQKFPILPLEWRRYLSTIKSCNYFRFPVRHLNLRRDIANRS